MKNSFSKILDVYLNKYFWRSSYFTFRIPSGRLKVFVLRILTLTTEEM